MTGWHKIGPHPALLAWATAAHPVAVAALRDTDQPLRCGGTWAVGLDLLPNAENGEIAGVPLPWDVLGLAPVTLHPAQLSTIHPGYPRPSDEETEAAFRFRLNRDAAHLDGLLPVGPDRLRMIKEPHAWIVGLPLTTSDAAPLVVWEGSHTIMQAALQAALAPHPPESWGDVDITAAYQAARAGIEYGIVRVLAGQGCTSFALDGFQVAVTCTPSAAVDIPEENRLAVQFFSITARAEHGQPGNPDYAYREITSVVERP